MILPNIIKIHRISPTLQRTHEKSKFHKGSKTLRNQDEPRIQVDPSGSKWIQVDPSGSKWIQVDPRECSKGRPSGPLRHLLQGLWDLSTDDILGALLRRQLEGIKVGAHAQCFLRQNEAKTKCACLDCKSDCK